MKPNMSIRDNCSFKNIHAITADVAGIKKNTVITVFFLIPATSAVIAWIFLNEQLSLIDIFGFIVASLGVFIATRKS